MTKHGNRAQKHNAEIQKFEHTHRKEFGREGAQLRQEVEKYREREERRRDDELAEEERE